MTKETELKNCPFCGESGELEQDVDGEILTPVMYRVRCICGVCDAQPFEYEFKTVEDAVEKWNTRPLEAKLEKQNKLMREGLEFYSGCKHLQIIGGKTIHFEDSCGNYAIETLKQVEREV